MKTLASIALAGALAATSVGATATGASAGSWGGGWQHHGAHHNTYYVAPDAGGALVAGAILGLTLGMLAAPAFAEPPPPPLYYRSYAAIADEEHFDWCAATYETYNGESDTWVDFRGVEHRCVEPY